MGHADRAPDNMVSTCQLSVHVSRRWRCLCLEPSALNRVSGCARAATWRPCCYTMWKGETKLIWLDSFVLLA